MCDADTRKGVAACESLIALLLLGWTRAGVGVEGAGEASSAGGSGVPSMG